MRLLILGKTVSLFFVILLSFDIERRGGLLIFISLWKIRGAHELDTLIRRPAIARHYSRYLGYIREQRQNYQPSVSLHSRVGKQTMDTESVRW